MSALAAIRIGGSCEPWLALGLSLTAPPATITIGSVDCRFDVDSTASRPTGITGLGVVGLAGACTVDGLAFFGAEARQCEPREVHPCRASIIDHVVVMTSSLDRTTAAVEASIGAPLRRIREVGNGIRQGFHRLGEVILEVVETPQHEALDATFWGLVIVLADLPSWAQRLGPDLVAPPKTAVQPGRLISNVRGAAGLGFPVALMSPAAQRPDPHP